MMHGRRLRQLWRVGVGILAASAVCGLTLMAYQPTPTQSAPAARYRSPFALAYAPDGQTIAVTDRTAGALVLLDTAAGTATREVALQGQPTGVAWSVDGTKAYVAEYGAGTVAEVTAADGTVARRLAVGRHPMGVALAAKRNVLVVANQSMASLSLVDLTTGTEAAVVPAVREPYFVTVTPDETLALAGNLCPLGDATDAAQMAAKITVVDLEQRERLTDIALPVGSTNVRTIAVSPNGKWAYVVHSLARFTLPTTQLERGWVNTNAFSIIDLAGRSHFATVLLDRLSEGAADPWGIALSADGGTAWVSLAGINQVAKLDLTKLHGLLGPPPGKPVDPKAVPYGSYSDIWAEIKRNPLARYQLQNDLAALTVAGILTRVTVPAADGLRDLRMAPNGTTLAAAVYFSGDVALLTPESCAVAKRVPVGTQPAADAVRRGEMRFADARLCFQRWLTCVTCHPDGRTDGLNWDLMNDGIGNPKNNRSMVWSHKTPPVMSLGVRADMETATKAGYRFIQFTEPSQQDVDDTIAYLKSLEPEVSPYRLANGELSAKALRGKAIFESPKAGCAACHPAPLYTDLKLYDVGTRGKFDREGELKFDNPTLVELWRTAPYLHDGRAVTLTDVLTTHNAGDTHGKTSHLTRDQVADLVEYLLSL